MDRITGRAEPWGAPSKSQRKVAVRTYAVDYVVIVMGVKLCKAVVPNLLLLMPVKNVPPESIRKTFTRTTNFVMQADHMA
jgi:hypothetical protein